MLYPLCLAWMWKILRTFAPNTYDMDYSENSRFTRKIRGFMKVPAAVAMILSYMMGNAQTAGTWQPEPLYPPDLGKPTHVAPGYFGPNAMPVLPMLDGIVDGRLSAVLSSDTYFGYHQDFTTGLRAELHVPLFTRRATLSVWMPVVETFRLTDESIAHSSVTDTTYHGTEVGDVYISTDILLLEERKICPDIALRIGIKTASGDGYRQARFFDSPAYWFDASFGKQFTFGTVYPMTLRAAVSAGFLCWQTDHKRQNDAVMYAARLKFSTRHFSLSETYGGYHGWEHDGDSPMVLNTDIEVFIPLKKQQPYCHDAMAITLHYGYGIRDYPYHALQAGIVYRLPVMASKPK